MVGVVGGGAVGDLDDQPARAAHQQRQRVVARDQVRVDREPQQPQAVVEVVLPDRLVPLEQVLGAPDVVDEHVEPALLGVDALDQARPPAPGRGGRPRPRCPRRRPRSRARRSPRSSPGGRPRSAARACCGRSRRPWRPPRRARPRCRGRRRASRPPPARPCRQWSAHAAAPSIVCRDGSSRARAPRRARARRRASCTAPSVSPKTRNASSTVTSGSTVARIDAVVGPTRRRPAKKRLIAATVETHGEAGEPAPAGGRQLARPQLAEQRRADASA